MTKQNVYEEVTNQIISLLEQGQIPWHKPWTGGADGAYSWHTGRPYSLLNQLILVEPGEYITFDECRKNGGHIKKGAKAKHVYLWKPYKRQATDEDGNPKTDEEGNPVMITRFMLRCWPVFHVTNDCEGIKPKRSALLPEVPAKPIEAAEEALRAYVEREGIRLEADEISSRAYYSPANDLINLPCIAQFADPAEYYSTAYHEATHSTGHPSRLHRFELFNKNAAFGSEQYSKEELTAEIGAACILHRLGIGTPASIKNSAAYIQGWLKALKDDKQLIIGAAARAEKAARLILNLEEGETASEAAEG